MSNASNAMLAAIASLTVSKSDVVKARASRSGGGRTAMVSDETIKKIVADLLEATTSYEETQTIHEHVDAVYHNNLDAFRNIDSVEDVESFMNYVNRHKATKALGVEFVAPIERRIILKAWMPVKA